MRKNQPRSVKNQKEISIELDNAPKRPLPIIKNQKINRNGIKETRITIEDSDSEPEEENEDEEDQDLPERKRYDPFQHLTHWQKYQYHYKFGFILLILLFICGGIAWLVMWLKKQDYIKLLTSWTGIKIK